MPRQAKGEEEVVSRLEQSTDMIGIDADWLILPNHLVLRGPAPYAASGKYRLKFGSVCEGPQIFCHRYVISPLSPTHN